MRVRGGGNEALYKEQPTLICKELYGGAWGYFWNKESAVDAVHKNATDMHESIYPYAIIERLEPGLFPVPMEREWFGWNEGKGGFYEIKTPEYVLSKKQFYLAKKY